MPTNAEIAQKHPKYHRALAQAEDFVPLSLDESTSFDVAGGENVEEAFLRNVEHEKLQRAIQLLDDRSKFVIIAMFEDDKSAYMLAEEMKISCQRVSQLKLRALSRLRKNLSELEPAAAYPH